MSDTDSAAMVEAALAAARPIVAPGGLRSGQLVRAGGRNVVVRATLERAGQPSVSLLVKQLLRHQHLGFTDWASLEFIGRTAPAIAPALRGGDASAAVFLMEDLGGSRSLDDVLRERDASAAIAGLTAVVRRTAELHAATCDIPDSDYLSIRAELPEYDHRDRRDDARDWRQTSCRRFDEWLAGANVAPAVGLSNLLDGVARSYAEPGPWLAFTHGDPAPTNNHIRGDNVRLLDFEYGGYRHALYDPTAWTVLCPMPDETLPAIASAYRDVVRATMPVASDDAAFTAAWTQMICYRSIAMLGWIPATVFTVDAPWVDDWPMRAAALGTVERLRSATAEIDDLAPLAETTARLRVALNAMWPEAAHSLRPRWPAFDSR